MGYRQAVRHQVLILAFPGSNPGTPAILIQSVVEFPDGVSPSGKAPGFDPGIPRFESWYPSHLLPYLDCQKLHFEKYKMAM